MNEKKNIINTKNKRCNNKKRYKYFAHNIAYIRLTLVVYRGEKKNGSVEWDFNWFIQM